MTIKELRFALRKFRAAVYVAIFVFLAIYAFTFFPFLFALSLVSTGSIMTILVVEHLSNPNYKHGDGFIEILAFGAVGLIILTS